jgi:hypothetical protein
MSNKLIGHAKVAKIVQLIERQIVNRVDQLALFVQLKKTIEHRTFHGQLYQSDLDYIHETLVGMTTKDEEPEVIDQPTNGE